jgi:putative hydrolase of the HAD superfamily
MDPSSMKPVILFDLGGTLAQYYERAEFPHILRHAVTEVQRTLRDEGLLYAASEHVWRMVEEEDYEAPDHRVRPLEERLARIFRLPDAVPGEDLVMAMCQAFMRPIFVRGRLYRDVHPALDRLSSEGFRMAVVSNTPWGSPSFLWREEMGRLGLTRYMDAVIFCVDVGWRKPARQIFDATLKTLQVRSEQCLFVGDDPRWDLAGPRAVGIGSILMDRRSVGWCVSVETVGSLHELADRFATEQ